MGIIVINGGTQDVKLATPAGSNSHIISMCAREHLVPLSQHLPPVQGTVRLLCHEAKTRDCLDVKAQPRAAPKTDESPGAGSRQGVETELEAVPPPPPGFHLPARRICSWHWPLGTAARHPWGEEPRQIVVGGRTSSSPAPITACPSSPKGPKETLPAVLKQTSGRTGAAWTAQCPVTEAQAASSHRDVTWENTSSH